MASTLTCLRGNKPKEATFNLRGWKPGLWLAHISLEELPFVCVHYLSTFLFSSSADQHFMQWRHTKSRLAGCTHITCCPEVVKCWELEQHVFTWKRISAWVLMDAEHHNCFFFFFMPLWDLFVCVSGHTGKMSHSHWIGFCGQRESTQSFLSRSTLMNFDMPILQRAVLTATDQWRNSVGRNVGNCCS